MDGKHLINSVLVVFRDEERDRSIAKHVMSVHINASGVNAGAQEGDIDIATMKKFVSYCRLKCAPRLSAAAATMLSSQVRSSRQLQRYTDVARGYS